MVKFIAGALLLALGLYQLYATYRYFNVEKKVGNKTTSPFLMLALSTSTIFGIILFGFGINLIFDLI